MPKDVENLGLDILKFSVKILINFSQTGDVLEPLTSPSQTTLLSVTLLL